MRGLLQELDGTTLKDLVDAYNKANGTNLRIRGRSVLLIPTEIVLGFFKPAIAKIIFHVRELLEVGGFVATGSVVKCRRLIATATIGPRFGGGTRRRRKSAHC